MKKASDLGLKTIQLEDQVLLVDKKGKLSDGDWFYNNFDDHQPKVQQRKNSWITCYNEFKIIASTKPLEGLPLLVIEDEGEIESFKIFPVSIDTRNNITKDLNSLERTPFIKGHNKAKETFKFTEEDLRKALWELGDVLFNNNQNGIKEGEPEMYFDTIIESLSKKELWVEVEEWSLAENVTAKNQNILKITNGQIKAVWK